MNRRMTLLAFFLLFIVAVAWQSLPAFAQSATGWTTLFDGTAASLSNWARVGDANWRVAEGAVQADSGDGFLVSRESYGNFQLRAEFWVNNDANSGIFLRCQNTQDIGADTSYEVNIYDKRPDPSYRTGAIVDVARPMAQINAGERWNTYEVTMQGSHLTVTLNGTRTVDANDTKFARGPIALQYGGVESATGIVKFRKVEIRTLP
jgi:hypothetical protein